MTCIPKNHLPREGPAGRYPSGQALGTPSSKRCTALPQLPWCQPCCRQRGKMKKLTTWTPQVEPYTSSIVLADIVTVIHAETLGQN